VSALVRLYPAAWRERYEDEFLALLEARPPTAGDRFDIIRGAFDARLHPQVRPTANDVPPIPEQDLRIARRLGFAGIVGAVLWPLAFGVALVGPVVYDGDGAYRDGSAALPIFFGAIAMLVASLLGHLISLPRHARVARISAVAAIPLLLVFGLGPWMWPFGLAAFGLVAILAVAGLWAKAWPGWASSAVVGGVLCVVLVAAVGIATYDGDRMAGGVFFLVAGLALVPAWLGVGGTLVWPRSIAAV
jgi:hypothetical protein